MTPAIEIERSIKTFINDKPDSRYQLGYLAALVDILVDIGGPDYGEFLVSCYSGVKDEISEELKKVKADLCAYKEINTELHVRIAHLNRALRRVQGSDNLKDCHRIAEAMLNNRDGEVK